MKDSLGWQLVYVSDRFEPAVRHIALNAKLVIQNSDKMLAVATADSKIHLGMLVEGGSVFQPIGSIYISRRAGHTRSVRFSRSNPQLRLRLRLSCYFMRLYRFSALHDCTLFHFTGMSNAPELDSESWR